MLRILEPFQYNEEIVEYVVVPPRYEGFTVQSIREEGCFVAIGRVLPSKKNELERGVFKDNSEYIAIGLCKPIKT